MGGSTPRPSVTLASPARRPVPHTAPHPPPTNYDYFTVRVYERAVVLARLEAVRQEVQHVLHGRPNDRIVLVRLAPAGS